MIVDHQRAVFDYDSVSVRAIDGVVPDQINEVVGRDQIVDRHQLAIAVGHMLGLDCRNAPRDGGTFSNHEWTPPVHDPPTDSKADGPVARSTAAR